MAVTRFAADADEFRAIGHGMIALFNMAVLLAILCVVLSSKAQTPTLIQQALGFVTWLVQQVVQPVSGGATVNLSASLLPAGSIGTTSTGTTGAVSSGSGSGSTTIGTSAIPTMRITPT